MFYGNEFCFSSADDGECEEMIILWENLASKGHTVFSSKSHRAKMIQYLHEEGFDSKLDDSFNIIFDVLHEKWVAAMTTHW